MAPFNTCVACINKSHNGAQCQEIASGCAEGIVKSMPKDMNPERDMEQETISVCHGSWKEARSGLWHSLDILRGNYSY